MLWTKLPWRPLENAERQREKAGGRLSSAAQAPGGAFPRATVLLWVYQGLEEPQQGKQQSKCFSEVLSSRPRGILNGSGLVYLA